MKLDPAKFWRAIWALCVLSAIGVPATAQTAGDPASGLRLAQKICSACHIVARNQDMMPNLRNPAPSFFSIADHSGVTAEKLQDFIQKTHRAFANGTDMPSPELTPEQTRDVVSYILSLRSGG